MVIIQLFCNCSQLGKEPDMTVIRQANKSFFIVFHESIGFCIFNINITALQVIIILGEHGGKVVDY